ncbi:hypothetical protein V7090_12190, partial [Priestia megaterium]
MKYLHNGGRPMGRLPKDREIQAIKRRVALVLLIIGSFILLLLQTPRLKFALHGIGSVVVHQLYQRMGYGRDMLEDFFKKMKIEKR